MAYVYLHRRLDTNEIFYVGIGNTPKHARAYIKSNRSLHWHRVAKKAGYAVEIIFDTLSWEEAKKKEIELIVLYGRLDMCNGCLINKTDGGDGVVGNFRSNETKQKMSDSLRGRKLSEEQKILMSVTRIGKKLGPHSQETKDKISKSNMGKKLSPEHIKNLSESHKGIKYSEASSIKKRLSQLGRAKSGETRKKLSIAITGKKLSEEAKLKISIANKGRKHTEEVKRRISEKMKIIRQAQKAA